MESCSLPDNAAEDSLSFGFSPEGHFPEKFYYVVHGRVDRREAIIELLI
jgi:hypothetical protein